MASPSSTMRSATRSGAPSAWISPVGRTQPMTPSSRALAATAPASMAPPAAARTARFRAADAMADASVAAESASTLAVHDYVAAMTLHLFAGLRVRDFGAARAWYEQVLGQPTFFPHATEAVWTLADERSLYIVENADPGHGVVLVFVDDLDAQVARIATRGVEPDERVTYANGVRKALYRDPDGNEVGFG